MTKRLTEAEKLHIFQRDNFTCQYCGLNAARDFETWFHAVLSVDHINPTGSNQESNLATACHACNLYKGDARCSSIEDARQIVQRKRTEAQQWFEQNVK